MAALLLTHLGSIYCVYIDTIRTDKRLDDLNVALAG